MVAARRGNQPAPGGALQKTQLQQVGLHHRFEGGGIFAETGSQGVEAHGAAAVALEHQGEQTPVTGIEAAVVNAMQA